MSFKSIVENYIASKVQSIIDVENEYFTLAKINDFKRAEYFREETRSLRQANIDFFKCEAKLAILRIIRKYKNLNEASLIKIKAEIAHLINDFVKREYQASGTEDLSRSLNEQERNAVLKTWTDFANEYSNTSVNSTSDARKGAFTLLIKDLTRFEEQLIETSTKKNLKESEYYEKKINGENEKRQVTLEDESRKIASSVAADLTLQVVNSVKGDLASRKAIDVEEIYNSLPFLKRVKLYFKGLLFNSNEEHQPLKSAPKSAALNSTAKTTSSLVNRKNGKISTKKLDLSSSPHSPLAKKHYLTIDAALIAAWKTTVGQPNSDFNERTFLESLYQLHALILKNIISKGSTGKIEDVALAYQDLFESLKQRLSSEKYKELSTKLPTLIASFNNYEIALKNNHENFVKLVEKCSAIKNALIFLFPDMVEQNKQSKTSLYQSGLGAAKHFFKDEFETLLKEEKIKLALQARPYSFN